MNTNDPVVELRGVSRTFAAGDVSVPALVDVSMKVSRGEYVAVVGPSGSGKSTMLNLLGLLDRPTEGAYLFEGIDTSTLDYLTRKLLALPMSYFSTRRTGDIQRRLQGMRQIREFLVQEAPSPTLDVAAWMREWGVDPDFESAGGLTPPRVEPPSRQVWLLQRSPGKPGARLGKTTGWIHRTSLKNRQVQMVPGVTYRKIDDEGLHITVTPKGAARSVLLSICPERLASSDVREWVVRGEPGSRMVRRRFRKLPSGGARCKGQ